MITAVVGANWGDEGKGKITDMIAESSDIVVRFQGGGCLLQASSGGPDGLRASGRRAVAVRTDARDAPLPDPCPLRSGRAALALRARRPSNDRGRGGGP